MALVFDTEETYGSRVEVTVSGPVSEYGNGTGSKAAALARKMAQGAKIRRKSHGVTWDGDSGNFAERFTYLVLG